MKVVGNLTRASDSQDAFTNAFANLTDVISYVSGDANKIIQVNGTGTGLQYGIVLGTAAAATTGTTGHTIPFLDGTNTWSGNQTISVDGTSAAQLTLSGATNNWINFGTNGQGAPTFTTRSTGTKLVLTNALSSTAADYALGTSAGVLWFGTPQSGNQFRWYGGTSLAASLTGAGALNLTSTIQASNFASGASVSGTNTGDQTITLTGDVTGSGTGSFATTLATVNSNTGSFGSTTAVPIITVNAKGLITAVSTATLGTAAVANTGTSGANVPLLNGANTWSNSQTITGGSLVQTTTTAPSIKGYVNNSLLAGSIGIQVVGKYAYMTAANAWGMNIVDISNPASPVYVGGLQDIVNLNAAFGIAVSGRYAYITASGTNKMSVVDVSNPYAPTFVATLNDASYMSGPRGIVVSGRYAYVGATSNNRVTIVDISNPANPVVAGSVQDNTNLQGIDGVFLVGKYLYCACKDAYMITIVDVSNPYSPTVVGHTTSDVTNLNNVHDVYVVGKTAFAVAQNTNGITAIDVSNPASPTVISSLHDSTNLSSPKHIIVAGKYAYISCNGNARITIVDVSNTASMSVIGSLQQTTQLGSCRGIFQVGKYLAVSADNYLTMVDVNGIETSALYTGLLGAQNGNITDGFVVGGTLNVNGGINIGGDLKADGGLQAGLLNLLPRTAPSAPLDGDIWTTTSAVQARINGSVKTVAFTDSNITGSATSATTATTLATGRTISITGDLAYTSPTFDGSGNITAAGTLATVNSNTGSFGSTSAIPVITVNGKGLITAVTTAALGTAATQNTGTSGANIPLLNGTNTWSAQQTFSGNLTATTAAMGSASVVSNVLLNISRNNVDPTTYQQALNCSANITASSGANSQAGWGIAASISTGGTQNITGAQVASEGQAAHNTAATVSTMVGLRGYTYNVSTGRVSAAYGIQGYIQNLNASATIGSAIAIHANTGFNTGGLIDNWYGVKVENSTPNTTTGYGLYIANQTAATTNYSIYSLGGQSYHAGKIGIGTLASAQLHSQATTEQLRLSYDGSHYASATVASTGSLTLSLTGTSPTFTFSQAVNVPDDAYNATSWDASTLVPTKNAVRDKIETTITNLQTLNLTFVIDGGGSAITTGIKGDLEVPFACTIVGWTLLADQSGSIVVDAWKDTYANYPPTSADVITASAKPTISSATKAQSSTLTGWTTAIAAGDIIRFNVNSVTSITRVSVSLKVTRTI